MTDHGRIRGVMLDTVDLDATTEFWTALLGLEEAYRDEKYAYLAKTGDDGIQLAFQLVPEEKVTKNRMHLDIEVPDREAFAKRLVEAGGWVIADHEEGELPVWTVMADPLGNEFCIYARKAT